MAALVVGGEGVIGRQHGGVRIGAAEDHRAGVAGDQIAVAIHGGNGDIEGRPGRNASRRHAQNELGNRRHGRGDGDRTRCR